MWDQFLEGFHAAEFIYLPPLDSISFWVGVGAFSKILLSLIIFSLIFSILSSARRKSDGD